MGKNRKFSWKAVAYMSVVGVIASWIVIALFGDGDWRQFAIQPLIMIPGFILIEWAFPTRRTIDKEGPE